MAAYQLVMKKGPMPGKTFDLVKEDLTLGRDIHTDLVINIPEVSRKHARLRRGPKGHIIEDLGSTNGTFVNGQRLAGPYTLQHGDTIMLGDAVVLIYHSEEHADLNATLVSPANPVATVVAQEPATIYAQGEVAAAPQPKASAPPPPASAPLPPASESPPAYAGQVPLGPGSQSGVQSPAESSNRTWLYAGMGCLAILLCVAVAGAIIFDMMNLYCQPPFDTLFSFLYTC